MKTVSVLCAALARKDAAWVLPPRPALTELVQAQGGRTLRADGEGLCAWFPTPAQAFAAATALQRATTQANGGAMPLRAGIHHGEATGAELESGGGALVDLTRAVMLAARPGAVHVSSAAFRHLDTQATVSKPVRPLRVPGQPVLPLHDVGWHPGQRLGQLRWAPLLLTFAVASGVLLALYASALLEEQDQKDAMMAVTPIVTPAAADAGALAVDPTQLRAEPNRAARAALGTLTLHTVPPAQVYERGRLLGQTPFFALPLAPGAHRLELQGPDGPPRRLSVPIVAGENLALRLKLDELPAD